MSLIGVHITACTGAAENLDLSIQAMQDAAEAIFAQYSTFKEKSAMRAEFLVQKKIAQQRRHRHCGVGPGQAKQ